MTSDIAPRDRKHGYERENIPALIDRLQRAHDEIMAVSGVLHEAGHASSESVMIPYDYADELRPLVGLDGEEPFGDHVMKWPLKRHSAREQMAAITKRVEEIVHAQAVLLEAAEYALRVLPDLFEKADTAEDMAVLDDLRAAIAIVNGGPR